jgi:hypothetical protein
MRSRCQAAELGEQDGVGGQRVLDVGGQAALLDELAQRERPAGRLEQVGAEQGVVRDAVGDRPERLGVVGDDRVAVERLDDLLGALARAR